LKKQLVIAATVATLGLGTLGVAGIANAATTSSNSTGTSIVDKLVAKFGLSKSDVQAVFDEDRSAHEAARLQEMGDKLAAGVKAGTITQAQSDAITAKVKGLQSERDANRTKMESMTDDERKAAMDAERSALKQWISDNKIPDEFARLLEMGGHAGPPPSDSSSNTN
jgi:outer membrane murein-binding lipoprotein Lpp